jgi:hypothetical protein
MPRIVVFYHDPIEVDRSTSWTGLCPPLKDAQLVNIRGHKDPRVTALFDYARPDAVITVDGEPAVSIEQTAMNPSGHNIPQRFSSQVRSAELGVPSVLYYPEYSRRTFSDPNVRYLQVRVPLAQQRLSQLYNIPALSVFWPTHPVRLLPDTAQSAHQGMADVVGALVENIGNKGQLLSLPEIQGALAAMDGVVAKYAAKYRKNPSVRRLLPGGFPDSRTKAGIAIDPPTANRLYRTEEFLHTLAPLQPTAGWDAVKEKLLRRELTLVFTGTANKKRTDSEHPYAGYLTLFDILYLRENGGLLPTDRRANLIYRLPVELSVFLPRLNSQSPPTAAYIVDTFADLLLLNGGVVAGRPMRGNAKAYPVLLG